MHEKFNRSEHFNNDIFKKLEKKGMPIISKVKDALKDKNQEFISLNYNNKNKNKKNKINFKDREIIHSEEMKFIQNYNKKLESSLSDYNIIKKDNNFFINSFENLKKLNKKASSNKQEEYNYIYGGLLKKYVEKGLIISKNKIDKDIYKESSLLTTNENLNKFYQFDFIINRKDKEKRTNKNINFLKKIKKQVHRIYKNALIKNEKKEENDTFMNVHERKKINQMTFIKNKSTNLILNNINYTKDIQNEKNEIKKIKNLILEEEKELFLKRNKTQKINMINNNNKRSNSFILRIDKGKIRTINPIMTTKYNYNDNPINRNNNIILEYNNMNKNIIQNKNNINSIQTSSTNLSNANINNNENETKEKKLYYIYNQLSFYDYIKKRQTSINLSNKNNQINYSNYLSSRDSIFINLRKKRKTKIDLSNKINNALSMNEAYDKISKSNLDFISFKENSEEKRIKVDNLLKKYYGKKYQAYNKKTNHIKIMNNYQKIKEKIIKSEYKNIFIKYKKELPKLLQNKIELNLKLNKKLKNYGNEFIFSFYDKKLNV